MRHWRILLIIGFALSLIAVSARASILESIDLEYRKFIRPSNFLELPREVVGEGFDLVIKSKPWGPIYWNNRIHVLTTSAQVKWAGLQSELGVSVWRIDVGCEHHSQHELDSLNTGWPNENSILVRGHIFP